MTVTTTPPPGSRSADRRWSAHNAISSSPSTTAPRRSTASTRSPSPSNAKPASNPPAGTAAAPGDVAPPAPGPPPPPPRRGPRAPPRQHQRLDLRLRLVEQLHAVGTEELDAVVEIGIVRRRHDAGEVEAHPTDEQRGAGRGEHAADQRVTAGRGDPRGERRLEHLPGLPGVADDQHLRCRGRRVSRRRAAEGEREVGGEKLSDGAAYAIGAEQPALPGDHSHGG